eukprot:TRINITY_DN1253_c0_g1_i1.p1 TRINITY_DN1253_c0_g1~~TRINITY_DN1253_c0_g1_i1.p1  ORF type:complete len:203 (+),score=23.61 TRINITY_DN1253_c0_g1_i1:1707-2315(+)
MCAYTSTIVSKRTRYVRPINLRCRLKHIAMAEKKSQAKEPANEIRVTGTTYIRTYLAYVARLFEEKHDTVVVKAIGNAIPRAVNLGLLVRKRFKGIHQIAEVSMIDLNDRDRTRKVALISITLSKKSLDKSHIGYAAPLPDSEVVEYKPYAPGQPVEEENRERGQRFRERGRGRGREGYGRDYGGHGRRPRGSRGGYRRRGW